MSYSRLSGKRKKLDNKNNCDKHLAQGEGTVTEAKEEEGGQDKDESATIREG